ncbi:MAG: aminoacyl-tRNA hydrolase [Solirubrobacteraceae bacterium]
MNRVLAPHDTTVASAPARDDELWAMYYVVRSDRRLSFGQAIALGGAGAVACADRFRDSERWRANFTAWQAAEYPKVALRARADQFAALTGIDATPVPTHADPIALCLPPRRKSEREPELIELAPFTDAKLPAEPPATPGALVYIIRPGVIKSMGKAIAQAGHAALALADEMAATHRAELKHWREAGMPGEVRLADDRMWEPLKAAVECVVIRDAGYTQVAAGTETVLALPPLQEQPSIVTELERLP